MHKDNNGIHIFDSTINFKNKISKGITKIKLSYPLRFYFKKVFMYFTGEKGIMIIHFEVIRISQFKSSSFVVTDMFKMYGRKRSWSVKNGDNALWLLRVVHDVKFPSRHI